MYSRGLHDGKQGEPGLPTFPRRASCIFLQFTSLIRQGSGHTCFATLLSIIFLPSSFRAFLPSCTNSFLQRILRIQCDSSPLFVIFYLFFPSHTRKYILTLFLLFICVLVYILVTTLVLIALLFYFSVYFLCSSIYSEELLHYFHLTFLISSHT